MLISFDCETEELCSAMEIVACLSIFFLVVTLLCPNLSRLNIILEVLSYGLRLSRSFGRSSLSLFVFMVRAKVLSSTKQACG